MEKIPATLIPGDGIGPEIVKATLKVLDALGASFEWDVQQAGVAAETAHGDPLPQTTIDSVRKTKLALKGPLTTPVGSGFRSINVRLREEFQLFANVRPARSFLLGGRFENVDLVLIRENLEGLYVGVEHYIPIAGDPKAVAEASGIITRYGCTRFAEFAFNWAIKNKRKKVTIVHKANILKKLTGLFLETATELGKKYEGQIEVEERIVDNCAMQLVLNPNQFDVLITTNMFGDILSDEIAGLVGGLGLAPSANIGKDASIFEAVHGSAPDIAGKKIANPTALMLAAALMLDHVEESEKATSLREALDAQLRSGEGLTVDLGGTANTEEFADNIIARL
ncbi:MAG: isocitrate/isopropylmalate family dehydrogenase [Gammaproteobacteria bacterium]|nr:isocitrate/isopropylmalate family dehydrogenase [Gammaproteobacteria bacterium]